LNCELLARRYSRISINASRTSSPVSQTIAECKWRIRDTPRSLAFLSSRLCNFPSIERTVRSARSREIGKGLLRFAVGASPFDAAWRSDDRLGSTVLVDLERPFNRLHCSQGYLPALSVTRNGASRRERMNRTVNSLLRQGRLCLTARSAFWCTARE